MGHRSRRVRRAVLALTLVAATAVGCGDDDDTSSPSGADAASDAATEDVAITASDYAFDAPQQMEGGVVTVTFANEGEQPHELGLMQLEEALDVDAFGELVAPVFEGGPIPDEIVGHSGITELEPGAEVTSTFTLDEGTYAMYCSIADEPASEGAEEPEPHFALGMYEVLEVEGDNDASLPDGDGLITATDYEFAVPDLGAGEQQLTFRNESPEQLHHVVLFEFPEGTDEAAAAAAWNAGAEAEQSGSPLPAGTPEPDDVGGSQVFGPRGGGTFRAMLQSGLTYAAVCFLQDRDGGPPHAFGHGMVTYFTVP